MLYGYRQLYYSFKTDNFYKDIVDVVEKWFDTSNYEDDRPLLRGMKKTEIGFLRAN